jgi:hypothetical protein
MTLRGFPGGPLFLDQVGRLLTDVHPAATGDSVEELLRQRASRLALKDSLDVLG